MPFYLRVINKNRWHRDNWPSWIPENDLPPQPLYDLVPKPQKYLSLWRIDGDEINLNRITAAIASGRDRIDKIDYALFTVEIINDLGLTVVLSSGETPDDLANSTCHWDLVGLTANKVVLLARALLSKAEINRKLPAEVERLVTKGIELKELNTAKISVKLLRDLKTSDA